MKDQHSTAIPIKTMKRMRKGRWSSHLMCRIDQKTVSIHGIQTMRNDSISWKRLNIIHIHIEKETWAWLAPSSMVK